MAVLSYEMKRAHWRATGYASQRFRERAVEIGELEIGELLAMRAVWLRNERRLELDRARPHVRFGR